MSSCGCGCMYEKVVKDFPADQTLLHDMKGIPTHYLGLATNVTLEK